MSLALATVSFVVGAAVSLGTSWLFVSRLEMLGERLGLSEALLGVLAALAADAPEITASITAISHHQQSVGAGVVLGSNVFNLAALLGLGAVVAGRIGLHRKVVLLGGGVAMWVAAVCLGAVEGVVEDFVALVLVLVVLVPYMALLGRQKSEFRRLPLPRRWLTWLSSAVAEEELELVVAIRPKPATPGDALVAAAALIVVIGASAAMETGASRLGAHYGVPDAVVGGLVLAAVTSLPNAVAAVYLAGKGRGAAALSTALSSNTLNVVAGLLAPGLVVGLARPSSQGFLIAGWYVGLTALTLTFAYFARGLRRWQGCLIITGYAVFVACLLALS